MPALFMIRWPGCSRVRVFRSSGAPTRRFASWANMCKPGSGQVDERSSQNETFGDENSRGILLHSLLTLGESQPVIRRRYPTPRISPSGDGADGLAEPQRLVGF